MHAGDDGFGRPIHEFDKAKRVQVRFHIQSFAGQTFLDVREFHLGVESGTWTPTRKGFAVGRKDMACSLDETIQAGRMLGFDLERGDDGEGGFRGAATVVTRPRGDGGPSTFGPAADLPGEDVAG